MAKDAFNKRKELLTRSIRVDLRKRLVKTLVRPVVGVEKNGIGHVVRGDGLMKLVLEGGMEGKRPRGRPRMGMIDDVLDETYGDMKRKAENRESWRIWKPRTCP